MFYVHKDRVKHIIGFLRKLISTVREEINPDVSGISEPSHDDIDLEMFYYAAVVCYLWDDDWSCHC